MSRTRSGDVLVAFAVGGLVGAVAALMLAPAAGPETRRRLREAGFDETASLPGLHGPFGEGQIGLLARKTSERSSVPKGQPEISRWWSEAKPPEQREQTECTPAGVPEISTAPAGADCVAAEIRGLAPPANFHGPSGAREAASWLIFAD